MPHPPPGPTRVLVLGLVALLLAAIAAGCGAKGANSGVGAKDRGGAEKTPLRLGYFPNLTHASALVGVDRGIMAAALGPGVKLEPAGYNAGPPAVEALFSGGLDASYMGPSPAINAYTKSQGEAIRIISGATSGGVALVVRPSIANANDLRGKKLATPQLGGTQDVALRWWLEGNGLRSNPQGGGDVSIVPQENAQTLETFRTGDIDGAWVPEPWATRLVSEGGAKVLVDERSLWPGGRFATTLLVVRTAFLREHPDVVRGLLRGQVEANDFLRQNPSEAQRLTNEAIASRTGKRLPDQVVAGAWRNLEFTNDPVASSLTASAQHAESVGLLGKTDLRGIFDLSPLNEVLRAKGQPEVTSQ